MSSRYLALLLLLTSIACNHAAIATSPRVVDTPAAEKWKEAMRVVRHVARGGRFDPHVYDEAATLLEKSTCIYSGDDYSSLVGRIPSILLDDTVPRWDAWWSSNRCDIYYDAEYQELRFRDARPKCPRAS